MKEQNTENRFVYSLRNKGGHQFGGTSQSAICYEDYKLLQSLPLQDALLYNIKGQPVESNLASLHSERLINN